MFRFARLFFHFFLGFFFHFHPFLGTLVCLSPLFFFFCSPPILLMKTLLARPRPLPVEPPSTPRNRALESTGDIQIHRIRAAFDWIPLCFIYSNAAVSFSTSFTKHGPVQVAIRLTLRLASFSLAGLLGWPLGGRFAPFIRRLVSSPAPGRWLACSALSLECFRS